MATGRIPPCRLLFWQNIQRTSASTSNWSSQISRRFLRVPPLTPLRHPRPILHNRSRLSPYFRSLRFNTTNADTPLSFSQRMRKLSREYGWAALGVYFGLLVLDMPLCLLAVRTFGVERIAHYEHIVLDAFWNLVHTPFPNFRKSSGANKEKEVDEAAAIREEQLGWSGDIEAADARNRGAGASIWTQLALAFVIHKSFIFIRVPLTAAITPKVVKYLRARGWDIGKRKPKAKVDPPR